MCNVGKLFVCSTRRCYVGEDNEVIHMGMAHSYFHLYMGQPVTGGCLRTAARERDEGRNGRRRERCCRQRGRNVRDHRGKRVETLSWSGSKSFCGRSEIICDIGKFNEAF